jgi:hypothetical protein
LLKKHLLALTQPQYSSLIRVSQILRSPSPALQTHSPRGHLSPDGDPGGDPCLMIQPVRARQAPSSFHLNLEFSLLS